MKVADTCNLCYIVSNFSLRTNVTIQKTLSLLSNNRNTSQKLLLSTLNKLAIDCNCFDRAGVFFSALRFLSWALIHKLLPVAYSSNLLSILCFLFVRSIISELFFGLFFAGFWFFRLFLCIFWLLCLYLYSRIGLFCVRWIGNIFYFPNFSFCNFHLLIDRLISIGFYLKIFELLSLFLMFFSLFVHFKIFRVLVEVSLELIIVLIFDNIELDAFPRLLSVEKVDWRSRLQH